MKNMLVLALLLASTAAYADNSVAAPSTPPAQGGAAGGAPGQGERFEEVKAKILARIQQHQACVQAATNIEGLKACRPKEGEGGRGGGGGFGGGRFRGGQQGGAAPAAPQ